MRPLSYIFTAILGDGVITRFTSVLQIVYCCKRRYFQLNTGERVKNLAQWSRLDKTTMEMFQGSWSYIGLQWRAALARHSVEGGVVIIIRPLIILFIAARQIMVQRR